MTTKILEFVERAKALERDARRIAVAATVNGEFGYEALTALSDSAITLRNDVERDRRQRADGARAWLVEFAARGARQVSAPLGSLVTFARHDGRTETEDDFRAALDALVAEGAWTREDTIETGEGREPVEWDDSDGVAYHNGYPVRTDAIFAVYSTRRATP